MNKRTLEALKGSIKKWEKIVKATTAKDGGIRNCPLCGLFHALVSKNYLSESCRACPIYNKTGALFCNDTPYQEWSEHQYEKHYNSTEDNHRYVGCEECLTLAEDELKFLKRLLPKVKK